LPHAFLSRTYLVKSISEKREDCNEIRRYGRGKEKLSFVKILYPGRKKREKRDKQKETSRSRGKERSRPEGEGEKRRKEKNKS